MNIDFPFHFDVLGRSAGTDDSNHVRDMIEQLLFTRQGERVMRADFGSGLLHALFEPNSPELAKGLEFTTRAAVQRWLGDVVEVRSLDFTADDSRLQMRLVYLIRRTGELRAESFEIGGAP